VAVKAHGGKEVNDAWRLRAPEEQNNRLIRLVANQAVQIQILKEVNSKSGEPLNQAALGETSD